MAAKLGVSQELGTSSRDQTEGQPSPACKQPQTSAAADNGTSAAASGDDMADVHPLLKALNIRPSTASASANAAASAARPESGTGLKAGSRHATQQAATKDGSNSRGGKRTNQPGQAQPTLTNVLGADAQRLLMSLAAGSSSAPPGSGSARPATAKTVPASKGALAAAKHAPSTSTGNNRATTSGNSTSRPVTPHITAPYRPGQVRPPPGVIAAPAEAVAHPDQHPSTQHPQCSRPPTAAVGKLNTDSAGASAIPSTALPIRPGTAAAAKILRSLRPAVGTSSRPGTRPATAITVTGAAATAPAAAAGSRGSHSAGGAQARADACAARSTDVTASFANGSQTMADGAEDGDAETRRPSTTAMLLLQALTASNHDNTSCSRDDDVSATGAAGAAETAADGTFSVPRPSTAAQRDLLTTACNRDGVAERLQRIRCLNSEFDATADIDIVHSEDEQEQQQNHVPGPPVPAAPQAAHCPSAISAAASTATAKLGRQAAPMVLNLEDFVHSTPEVIEMELESLGLEELQAISKALGAA